MIRPKSCISASWRRLLAPEPGTSFAFSTPGCGGRCAWESAESTQSRFSYTRIRPATAPLNYRHERSCGQT